MKRHASADELADLAAGVLKPRKTGKISAHLSDCAHCTDVGNQLANVSSLLASVPVAAMPANLSSRIETAIAAESAQRLASEPATEAGRRDLPARGRPPRRTGQGWRMPALSGPASRLVAAAGALAIIGGGGYEIATHLTAGSAPSSSSSSTGSVVVPGQQLSSGPSISVHEGGVTKSVKTVRTDTNFTGPKLAGQAVAALRAAQVSNGVAGSGAVPQASHLSTAAGASDRNSPQRLAQQSGQLAGCVAALAKGRHVWLVELARFDGRPAIIVMIASAESGADVFAVGSSCTATNTEVLSHAHVAHI